MTDSYTSHMVGIAEVAAVHDDQVLLFLERLGVLAGYQSGELRCSVCREPLIEAGLGAARGVDGDFLFACAKLDCQDEFHSR